MAPSSAFDPVEFKRNIRTEWRSAADGWRRWLDVVEAPEGGQQHSAKLIELAELRPGDRVLDVGGGYGEPSLSAARVVGPEGRGVVCTDISAEMLATARERADAASSRTSSSSRVTRRNSTSRTDHSPPCSVGRR